MVRTTNKSIGQCPAAAGDINYGELSVGHTGSPGSVLEIEAAPFGRSKTVNLAGRWLNDGPVLLLP
jgi:hypothetical protein